MNIDLYFLNNDIDLYIKFFGYRIYLRKKELL